MTRTSGNYGPDKGRVGVIGGGTVATPTVHNDRAVRARVIVCPDCLASVGAPCVSRDGQPVTSNHVSRRRMALRAEIKSATYSAADVAFVARGLSRHGRKMVRKALGLTQQELADILGISYQRLRHWEPGTATASGADGAKYGRWLRENAHLATEVAS